MEWLDESEKTLDSEVEIANDPDKIKTQLAQHKVTEHHLITAYWEKNESENNQGTLIASTAQFHSFNINIDIHYKLFFTSQNYKIHQF